MWVAAITEAMYTRTRRTAWAITHQVTVMIALTMFPLALFTERVGIPLGTAMHRVIDTTLTKYENTRPE